MFLPLHRKRNSEDFIGKSPLFSTGPFVRQSIPSFDFFVFSFIVKQEVWSSLFLILH